MDDGKSHHRNTNAVVLFSKAAAVQRSGKDDPFAGLPWTDFDSLFSAMFDDVLEQASRLHNTDIIVFRDQTEFSDEFLQRFTRSVKCFDIVGKTPGEQLKHAIESTIAQSYSRIVIILENHPLIDAPFLQRLFEQLQYEEECIILGPNVEGNFHLVALKNSTPQFMSAGEDLASPADGILKRVCAVEAVLFLTAQRYSLSTGNNLLRLKNEITERIGQSSEFPHRTHATFSAFEKRYKLKKTTS